MIVLQVYAPKIYISTYDSVRMRKIEIYSFVIILEKHNHFVYIVWCDFMGNFKNENTEGLFCNMR